MPVCLHCGEPAPEGALFCAKCGFTLPQAGIAPPAPSPAPLARPVVPVAPPVAAPPPGYVPYAMSGPYAVPAAVIPGAVAAIAPPPNAKFCNRCRTPISRAAVYCPVCQQPQL